MKARHIAGVEPHELKSGQWCSWNETIYARCPNGLLANLEAHAKTVDFDTSDNNRPLLTVSPSILCTGSNQRFHGFIERGIWLGEDRQPVPTEGSRNG